jgi:hypothetical protein
VAWAPEAEPSRGEGSEFFERRDCSISCSFGGDPEKHAGAPSAFFRTNARRGTPAHVGASGGSVSTWFDGEAVTLIELPTCKT